MNEFAPNEQIQSDNSAEDRRIEQYMNSTGASIDEARRRLGIDQDNETPTKPTWQSKNEHPSNHRSKTDYKPRRSSRGPNFGEEEVDPIYFETGDVRVSPEQAVINSQGAAAVRAFLREQRPDPDTARQRALDRARDERRWNNS